MHVRTPVKRVQRHDEHNTPHSAWAARRFHALPWRHAATGAVPAHATAPPPRPPWPFPPSPCLRRTARARPSPAPPPAPWGRRGAAGAAPPPVRACRRGGPAPRRRARWARSVGAGARGGAPGECAGAQQAGQGREEEAAQTECQVAAERSVKTSPATPGRRPGPGVRRTWNSMGASGRHSGVEATVADLRMARSRPARARMLPAGTSCARRGGRSGSARCAADEVRACRLHPGWGGASHMELQLPKRGAPAGSFQQQGPAGALPAPRGDPTCRRSSPRPIMRNRASMRASWRSLAGSAGL